MSKDRSDWAIMLICKKSDNSKCEIHRAIGFVAISNWQPALFSVNCLELTKSVCVKIKPVSYPA